MNIDLAKIDEKALKAELARREAERELAAEREQEAHEQFILAHIDALLLLVPEHGRTSCDDDGPHGPCNYRRCNRCTLLHIREHGYVAEHIRLEININWPPREEYR